MGKCVVCSKSAGPFNSLHKTCLPIYQGVRKCLYDTFPECVNSPQDSLDPLLAIQACKPSANFSEVQFNELVVKAWLEQAKLVVKDPALNSNATKNLLRIADKFNINSEDVDDYLIVRLSNVEHLERIQNKQTIEKEFDLAAGDIVLMQNEKIIWEFKSTTRLEQQRHAQGKQWTVFSSVLNNILMRKRYKELAIKVDESGTLLVTNHSLYYKSNDVKVQTKFTDIHSVTPMRDGVRVQARTTGAMPDTYITGDGRFTYALLQYAQRLNT
ncbi:MAG: hypothetical protein AB8B92_03015 [Gammaproteobacteria bacterium]